MDLLLRGKTACITGGSRGIGFAIAEGLAKEGCHLILCARNQDGLESAKQKLQHHGVEIDVFQMDALDFSSVNRCLDSLDRSDLSPDILINNVGGGGRWGQEVIEKEDFSLWQEVYQKNTGVCIQFTKWAIPKMRQKKWGRVIAIASFLGKEGGGRPWFTIAKSAEISLMKTLALTQYLVRDGITFNSLAVGSVFSPNTGWSTLQKEQPQEFLSYVEKNCPLGRLGTPEEVSHLACFLSSPQASWINGACISIDGAESRSF